MPYSGVNDRLLPSYVKTKSETIRKQWIALFNESYSKYGESKALLIANTWLKKQLQHKQFVKRSVIQFDVVNESLIKRSSDGQDYVTFVLSSTTPHRDGVIFTEEMLKKWEQKINADPIVGDIDHELYDKLLSSYLSDDQIRDVLRSKKGIAKTIKAIYDSGKLWIKAYVDKRYKRLIEKSRGVSAEALCSWNNNVATDGDILGFTFNINTTPADYLAGVVA
jgi:hypothetical protein